MTHDFDAVVVGGGPVGAAQALALARTGLSVAVVEGRAPVQPGSGWDARTYAISPGSRELLRELGAWQRLDAGRLAPIAGMMVWGDDDRSCIEFDSIEIARPDLGVIVEAGRLGWALWQSLAEAGITLCCPARCATLTGSDSAIALSLADGTTLQTSLVVGADGGDSWVRESTGIAATARAFEQTAVVANFACERPHGGIARQWFRGDGVLAWLPLPDSQVSIVWSADSGVAEQLMTASTEELSGRVAAAGDYVLGAFEVVTPPSAFPLRQIHVGQAVKPGIALIGDAAHVIHPLAGQGVNLGFRDVKALAEALAARPRAESPGSYRVLRAYERARREDWLATRWLTGGLQRLFHDERGAARAARNFGFDLANQLPLIKRRLMLHAMQ